MRTSSPTWRTWTWHGGARLAGWGAVLQPQARVLHAHSATLGDASPRKRYLLARNKVWLLVKDYPAPDVATAPARDRGV